MAARETCPAMAGGWRIVLICALAVAALLASYIAGLASISQEARGPYLYGWPAKRSTPAELPHQHRHLYRVFRDVCVKQLEPWVNGPKKKKAVMTDRELRFCAGGGTDVAWPLPPRDPSFDVHRQPERFSSRFRVQSTGRPEACSAADLNDGLSFWMHAGHKYTTRKMGESYNTGHWIHDTVFPLLVALLTLPVVPANTGTIFVDVHDGMPGFAMNAAHLLAGLLSSTIGGRVTVERTKDFPLLCMRWLILPDNIAEMRLSDGNPEDTDDGTGAKMSWPPDYGVPGPAASLGRQVVDLWRAGAYTACSPSLRVEPRLGCLRRIMLYGRKGNRLRNVLNMDDAAAALRSIGVDVISNFEFADVPFVEIIRMMATLDGYLAAHGANIASNMFFLQPGAVLMEVLPNTSVFKKLLPEPSNHSYMMKAGHWSWSCPWDYLPSLNLVQAASLKYKCFPGELPPHYKQWNYKDPRNRNTTVCVKCVVEHLQAVNKHRSCPS